MSPAKVTLTGEKETLLITLFAKAEESKETDSILKDRFAVDVMEQIDYDFSKIKVNRDTRVGLALRAKVLDDWTRDFISENPHATILNIGCGLDSRIFRVNPPETVSWIDVDYPEVIQLRTQFYPHRPSGHSNIGTSVTESTWLEQVNASGSVLVIAEGLLYYLSTAEVEHLFTRVLQHFASGEIIFDVYSSLGVRIVNANAAIRATGANLRWSIEHPREMEQKIQRLKLMDEYNAYDSEHSSRMSFWFRIMLATMGKTPAFRRLVRLLRYKF